MAGASAGVPTVGAPSAVASTHGAALPAMMVQNPTMPLGSLPSRPLLQSHPQTLLADEYFKRREDGFTQVGSEGS